MAEAKLSGKNQIVIPKEARIEMNTKSGDHLLVEAIHGMTILYPKPKMPARHLRGLSKDIYDEKYLASERRSWR